MLSESVVTRLTARARISTMLTIRVWSIGKAGIQLHHGVVQVTRQVRKRVVCAQSYSRALNGKREWVSSAINSTVSNTIRSNAYC
jgi:hypothetical protein